MANEIKPKGQDRGVIENLTNVTDLGSSTDPSKLMGDSQSAMKAMMGAQAAMQTMGMAAQVQTAALNIAGQAVGATTAMAVQVVTDLVKTSKDSVKAQGEAFQKAN